MKSDGSVIIDTKVNSDGMEKGFKRIKDDMGSVAKEAQKAGNQITVAFSGSNVSKSVSAAAAKVASLEQQLAAVTSEYKLAISYDDDKAAQRLAAKQTSIYDRLELARQKLANEVAASAARQAAAEEKAAARAVAAAEKAAKKEAAAAKKAAAAQEKAAKKQLAAATKGARRFGSRLREISSGALVFNLISAGLRNVTSYFGSALKTSDEFNSSVAKLKAALLTAFQPIYEFALPILIKLIDIATRAVQAIGTIFARLAGKSDAQMAKNAKALYEQAKAIEENGEAAKKAQKYLASFDEIQQASKTEEKTAETTTPDFGSLQTEEYQSGLESAITLTSMALLSIGAILALSGINIPLGITMMALGAAGLYTEITTNWSDMKEMLQGSIGDVTAIASGAFLAIGAILAFTGAAIPLGIGLMVLGAAGLTGTIAARWDSLSAPIKTVLTSILAIISGAGLVLGVLLCLTGAGIGLGLALIFAGLAGTKNAWKLDDNPVTRFVKNMVNGIIGLINVVIEAMNDLFDLKFEGLYIAGVEVIPAFNKKLFNIQPIPMLAKGAVIPPNAPFAAILGDQKHGTNIEAPLETIQQAVALVMEDQFAGMMRGFEETVAILRELLEAVYGIQIGDEVIAQAVNRYNRKMNTAKGGA